MIGRLTGVIADRSAEGTCVVDVGGVGYEVFVPPNLLEALPRAPETVVLFVHTHVREDTLSLYGFPSNDARAVFRALLGVSSVGPKLAMSILNVLAPEDLRLAISREDKNAFRGISGVGKKIVERILIDLRDRLPVAETTAIRPKMKPSGATDPRSQVVNALIQMGYKPAEAERAVGQLSAQVMSEPVEKLLREALSVLA